MLNHDTFIPIHKTTTRADIGRMPRSTLHFYDWAEVNDLKYKGKAQISLVLMFQESKRLISGYQLSINSSGERYKFIVTKFIIGKPVEGNKQRSNTSTLQKQDQKDQINLPLCRALHF